MGQYHIPVNIDKREFLFPHRLGMGLKLREQLHSSPGTMQALFLLLAGSNGRGGGDIVNYHHTDYSYRSFPGEELIGRWAGDRVVIIGDYGEEGDYTEQDGDIPASLLYQICSNELEEKSETGDDPFFVSRNWFLNYAFEFRKYGKEREALAIERYIIDREENEKRFKDISIPVRELLEFEFEGKFQPPSYAEGDWNQWLEFVPNDGEEVSRAMYPDMVINIYPEQEN